MAITHTVPRILKNAIFFPKKKRVRPPKNGQTHYRRSCKKSRLVFRRLSNVRNPGSLLFAEPSYGGKRKRRQSFTRFPPARADFSSVSMMRIDSQVDSGVAEEGVTPFFTPAAKAAISLK